MLAIPPMSDECERCFSSAKILLSDRRSRLLPDIIEANECLRAWFGKPKKKAFDDETINIYGVEDMDQGDDKTRAVAEPEAEAQPQGDSDVIEDITST
jgi:hypothetical protein